MLWWKSPWNGKWRRIFAMTDPEVAKIFVEFAKFGFYGTLVAAMVGAALIFALACLSAWTSFKIEGRALVAIAAIIFLGTTAFGYFSLWQVPNIAAKVYDIQVGMSADCRPQPQPAKKD
jgi:hypothetical protein